MLVATLCIEKATRVIPVHGRAAEHFPGTWTISGQRGAVWALISCPRYTVFIYMLLDLFLFPQSPQSSGVSGTEILQKGKKLNIETVVGSNLLPCS